jgi:D-serine deaminase-like pyridoxal phosphate-dependent protein
VRTVTNVVDIDTPALVIDLDRTETNIREMADLATRANVRLRPHTKTHKSPRLAGLQRDAGASGITCAKVSEAEVMVEAGFEDILIAFPLYGNEKLRRLADLRRRARIQVSLDSYEVAEGLSELGLASASPIEVYVEVDTGLHRMGRAPGAPTAELVMKLASLKGITLVGLLSHAGHVYDAVDAEQAEQVIAREIDDLVMTRNLCRDQGVELPELSVGATPSVRREMNFDEVTEVRPGTYVFNDATMISLGVATEVTCAAHILATVVSRPTAERFVIDAGSKCLTSDGIGRPDWVRVAGRGDLSMNFINEEHGVGTIDLERGGTLAIGDTLRLIPSHICPVVNLFDYAYGVRGAEVVEMLAIAGRGRVR